MSTRLIAARGRKALLERQLQLNEKVELSAP